MSNIVNDKHIKLFKEILEYLEYIDKNILFYSGRREDKMKMDIAIEGMARLKSEIEILGIKNENHEDSN